MDWHSGSMLRANTRNTKRTPKRLMMEQQNMPAGMLTKASVSGTPAAYWPLYDLVICFC